MEKELIRYLSTMLGSELALEELTVSERKLAGWLINFYDLKAVCLKGARTILAFAKTGMHYTPVAIAKQLAKGQESLGLSIVYIPRKLGTHDIPRLVAANVSFVLAKRCIYLPHIGLSVSRAPEAPVLREHFSVPAQLLVLGYILRKWNGVITLAEGAKQTGFSVASIVHAFQEIEYFGAGDRKTGSDGRTMELHFKSAREIWEKCRSRFFNPCKRVVGVAYPPESAVESGVDALARISMLNEEPSTSFAMPIKGFRSLGVEELAADTAPFRLQLWHYSPTVLGGDRIDSASLYLSLRDNPDDRVQIELEKLEEEFKW